MSDAATLRLALAGGAAAELAHAADATLAVHLPGRRLAARNPGEIATALGGLYPTPLELLDFRSQEFVAGGQLVGIDAHFEFITEAGVARRVHWLQLEAGLVRQHLVLPEQPRTAARDAPPPGPELEPLLAGATERRVVPVGYSGARLERLVLRTGEAVYLKYVSATADWHMRVTGDAGREGLLYTKGHLGRLPPSCGHAVVLAEPAGSGWAVVTREVPRRRWAMTGAELKGHMSALGDLHATFRGAPPEVAATLRSRLAALAAGIIPAACAGLDYPDPAHRAATEKKIAWWSHALAEASDLLS